MQTPTVQQAYQSASEYYRAGRVGEAETICRQILAQHPDHIDSLQLLAIILFQMGNRQESEQLLRRAIANNPTATGFYINLGSILAQSGRSEEAIELFQQAVALAPSSADAHNNLGNALKSAGRMAEAADAYRRALEIRPHFPQACNNLGTLLQQLGRKREAIDALREAVRLDPSREAPLVNLAGMLMEDGQLEEAKALVKRALVIRPDYAEARLLLGSILAGQSRSDEAIVEFQQAIKLRPDLLDAYNVLALAMLDRRRPGEAIGICQQALRFQPRSVEVLNTLGNAYRANDQLDDAVDIWRSALAIREDPEVYYNLGLGLRDAAELDEALGCFRKAESLHPLPRYADEALITLHCKSGYDRQRLFEEHERWYRTYALPIEVKYARPPRRTRDASARLRIGYVSHHLGDNAVGRFVLPLLANHDRRNFEVYFYCDVPWPDAVTERAKSFIDGWRDAGRLSDERLAQQVREDQIDILVDLTMHFDGNRLLTFARRPAPVQVTWLAYCSTTGLKSIDYRLTDSYCDPPNLGDQFYSERSVRLSSFWCYDASPQAPPVAPPPAVSSGHITFGCLNSFYKVTADVLSTWAEIARHVPQSSFLVHSREGRHRQKAREIFAAQGADPQRLQFVSLLPLREYFEQYSKIDIALDPFPYGGGTTTCDALWMGVPVITLAGRTGVSRGGMSILSNAGFSEYIARTAEQYIGLATALSHSVQSRVNLRNDIRNCMAASPVMDGRRCIAEVEQAYNGMWSENSSP